MEITFVWLLIDSKLEKSESKPDKRQPFEISIFPAPLIEPEVKSDAINGKKNVVLVYQVIICGRLPQTRAFNVTIFSFFFFVFELRYSDDIVGFRRREHVADVNCCSERRGR